MSLRMDMRPCVCGIETGGSTYEVDAEVDKRDASLSKTVETETLRRQSSAATVATYRALLQRE